MIKQTIILSFILLFQPAKAQDSVINKVGENFMRMPSAVGLSIGLHTNGGDRFYNFGSVIKNKKVPPTKNTLFEVGSIAKTFTAYLLARAVIEKKLNLQDDIRKYLEGDYPNLEHSGQPVRILHLANETAGIPDWLPPTPDRIRNASPDSVSFLREAIYGKFTRADFYAALHEAEIDTIPGTKRRHSNAGADLLSYILEEVYHLPYERLVRKFILKPLKMGDTYFAAASSPGYGQLAKGYNENGVVMPYVKKGVLSTTSDLLKYLKLHLYAGNQIAKLALTKTANVDLGTNTKVVNRENNVYSVALNWFSYTHDSGFSQIWYDGGTHGFCAYIVFYPELKTSIVLLANTADQAIFNSLSGIAYEIAQEIKDME